MSSAEGVRLQEERRAASWMGLLDRPGERVLPRGLVCFSEMQLGWFHCKGELQGESAEHLYSSLPRYARSNSTWGERRGRACFVTEIKAVAGCGVSKNLGSKGTSALATCPDPDHG